MKRGMCFKCGQKRSLVDGHRVCTSCHVPHLCPKCNTNMARPAPAEYVTTSSARTKPRLRG